MPAVTQGRAVLQRVIRGRIVFAPTKDGRGYTFEAPTRYDKLFAGVAAPRPPLPSLVRAGDARGREHIGPEETFDGDYGRLVERAARALDPARKGGDPRGSLRSGRWRSRRPFAPEPVWPVRRG